jgi:[acyl-carrier-protein] S-malonyltransferase
MGEPWRDHAAWSVVEQAEAAFGEPLAPLLLDAPAEQLARTRDAQLAILLTSLVAWEAVRAELQAGSVAFAGHSLGQVTALIAAGALPLGDGVRFAARRAELTQAAADRHPGRMAALLGATIEQAEDACAAAPDACWVANDNAPGQVVIAGTAEGLDRASARAREIGIRKVMPLNVGGAFHTPLMAEAADALREEVSKITLAPPGAPIVSNDDGLPHTEPDEWSERLAPHVTVPVRWRETQTTLGDLGATTFVEVGHGSMLAALAKRTVPEVSMCNVATPDDLARLAEVH